MRAHASENYCMIIVNNVFLEGVEGFTTEEDQEILSRIEKQLKKRFAIGSQVSEHAIVQDFLKQVMDELLFNDDDLFASCIV